MTREQLNKIEKLCAEATAGPWGLVMSHRFNVYDVFAQDKEPDGPFRVAKVFVDKDCSFIAMARTAVPQMLARIRELEELLLEKTEQSGA